MVVIKRKQDESGEDTANDVPELSELERRRIENISRNSEYLKDLGLHVAKAPKKAAIIATQRVRKLRVPVDEPEDRRRSSRIASIAPANYVEHAIPAPKHDYLSSTKDLVTGDLQVGVFRGLLEGELPTANTELPSSSSSADTSSSLFADIDTMLNQYLGQPLADYGKAAVMKKSNQNRDVRFNKYSGVAEWKNCLYLWVNLGGETGYVNSFSEGGRFMIWFGGSKMHRESRIVQRLINTANFQSHAASVNESSANNDLILLFVRKEGEGYACFGRCQIVAADLETSPIQIKWTLKDFDKLVHIPYFQEIVA